MNIYTTCCAFQPAFVCLHNYLKGFQHFFPLLRQTRQVYNQFQDLWNWFIILEGGWVEGPSKQTERTDCGWVQSTFGAKAEQIRKVLEVGGGGVDQKRRTDFEKPVLRPVFHR